MCARQALVALGHAEQCLLYSAAVGDLSTSLYVILLKAKLLVREHNCIFQPAELCI